jgi:hypothetical protein
LKYFCLNLFIRELWFEEFIFIDSQRNLWLNGCQTMHTCR